MPNTSHTLIQIRVTAEQAELIREAAYQGRLSVAEWARRRLLDHAQMEAPQSAQPIIRPVLEAPLPLTETQVLRRVPVTHFDPSSEQPEVFETLTGQAAVDAIEQERNYKRPSSVHPSLARLGTLR